MDVKAAIRLLWTDSCTVYEYQEYQDENKATRHREVAVLAGEPCKLSFETLRPTGQTDTTAGIVQQAKLFIDETINIMAGSKITVTHGGRDFAFAQSGAAGIFQNHQEIPLVPFEEFS